MSNGSKTHSTFRPGQERVDGVDVALDGDRGGLADLPDHAPANASFSSAGSGSDGGPAAASRACGACPVSRVDAGVVDGAQPRLEQAVQLLQVLDRVPGRVRVVAGDLGQELLLDSLEYPFDLAAAHRAARAALWVS